MEYGKEHAVFGARGSGYHSKKFTNTFNPLKNRLEKLVKYISEKIGAHITSYRSVTGGDISCAYLLQTHTKKYFLKRNDKPFALKMFRAEQKGLQAIESTQTIAVPHVHVVESFEGKSFLLMDFVESKRPDESDFQHLGTQLASLHLCTQACFGFSGNNFIGSLPQSNTSHKNWADFYWEERIFPQLQLAQKNGLLLQSKTPMPEKAITVFNEIFGEVKPALLHGDLWGGNYLISTDGTPYLIDPAAYYGHSVADIAMSKLFGGFAPSFYAAYHEIIPKSGNYQQQIELYQFYYLLVHLNLFGSGYYPKVAFVLKRYF